MDKGSDKIRIKDIARLAGVSVGTVDRVLHERSGVAESSKKKVKEILQQLNYHPNMYASALASNKQYHFVCLLPQHNVNDYWTGVKNGIDKAIKAFSDFHITSSYVYYDQYIYSSFTESGDKILEKKPDGVILAPTIPEITTKFVQLLESESIPYIFIDSNIPSLNPLAFYGQKSDQSGYLAGKILMMLGEKPNDIVIFRQIYEGRIGSNQQENREKGFRKYMNEHYPHCCIHELNLSAKYLDKNPNMMETFFNEHPEVKCGITFGSKVYLIGEYLLEQSKTDFKLIGYDLLTKNVECLKKGVVDFLIAQQPTLQGYNCIESLCNHLIFKKEIIQYNYMPITLLTEENIDYYLEIHQNK